MGFYQQSVFVFFITVLLRSGTSLDCYYCNGKTSMDCRDPFPEETNSTIVNCSSLRNRGLHVISIYHIFLQDMPYKALGPEPHVCYKFYDGDIPVRGCGEKDFCQNYTTTICETCDTDACNTACQRYPFEILLLFGALYIIGRQP